jgi:hypothetical protein
MFSNIQSITNLISTPHHRNITLTTPDSAPKTSSLLPQSTNDQSDISKKLRISHPCQSSSPKKYPAPSKLPTNASALPRNNYFQDLASEMPVFHDKQSKMENAEFGVTQGGETAECRPSRLSFGVGQVVGGLGDAGILIAV